MTVLKTTNLTKIYGGKAAVDNISLSIEKGDIFGLIGQNGAGKTTFMRLATSLTSRDSGQIELFGESSKAGITASRARIGAMIETPALFQNLTAKQNLEYYRLQRGVPERGRVEEVLQIVKLTDTGKLKFKNFSLGMKQRLGLAVAMLSHPDFLIFDEPTNGLDPTGIVEMRDLIKRLNNEGITILISSHILTELAQVATKYAIIHHGRLLKTLTQAELHDECKRAIAITVDDAAKAAAVMETTLGIREYKQVSSNQIRVYEYLHDPAELSFALAQEGIRVASLQEVGDSLEEYYTNIIGARRKQS
ncbi:MAG: ATP-binding cassette domain-containing protein [Defluviitaleaceae bacterium]|nr:ATP-binding cassette domain-containing protein [Defluviitaleaceae bacterium]